jgi:hypothetical protein
MSKERELLESCLDEMQYHSLDCPELVFEIKELLAQLEHGDKLYKIGKKENEMNENDDLGFYERMIADGEDVAELLYDNTGNVGDIGELLQLAAQEIIRLRSLTVTDKDYSLLRDIGEYLHVEEYNDGARKYALAAYFDLYDSIFEKAKGPAHGIGGGE